MADPDYPYLAEDAQDRRAALAAATALFAPRLSGQFGDTTGTPTGDLPAGFTAMWTLASP